jgi:hypothetical protein
MYSRKHVDLIGHRYGRLLVIELIKKDKNRHFIWNCKCDCGKEIVLSSTALRSGNTKSCGCLFIETSISKCKRLQLPNDEAAFNGLYRSYKRNARIRGKSWNIDKENFRKLTKKSCFYCGIEPQSEYKHQYQSQDSYIYNGIDRLDNDIGYELHNAVSCCPTCNYAKRNMTQDQFLNWINRVHNYQNTEMKEGEVV